MYLLSRLGRLGAVGLSALTLTGCATLDVSSYVERGIDVKQYRTFAWGPADALSTGDPRLDNNQFFDERVRRDVDTHLAARGFEKTSSGRPDLLVHYHASVSQRIDSKDLDVQYGCAEGDCRSDVFDVGTLVIDLVDTRTNKLVWRGWARGTIDGVIDNQAWLERQVDEAVTRILEELPARL